MIALMNEMRQKNSKLAAKERYIKYDNLTLPPKNTFSLPVLTMRINNISLKTGS